jgi:hypothetical protein
MIFSRAPLAVVFALFVGCGSAPPAGLYSPAASSTSDGPPPGSSATPSAGAPDSTPAAVWASFTSTDCGVTLPMPGTPKVSNEAVDAPSGKLVIHSATSDLGDRAAIVSCSDIPAYKSSDDILDRTRDGTVSSMHGTLVASRSVTVGGFPGRDMILAVQDKKLAVRLVLAKQRLFTLVSLGFSADETSHFIDGFTIAAKP